LENILLEIRAEGLTGLGYAFNFAPYQAEAIRMMVLDLAKTLVGKNVQDLRQHWSDLWFRINFIGQAGPPVMALACIDTALWDLFAQEMKMPLYRLLGAVREEVELYPTGGFLTDPIEKVIEEVLSSKQRGFTKCKIKVGRPDWNTDIQRVAQLRKAVGDGFGIMVDANQSWSVNDAIAAGRQLQELGVIWLEEPVSVHNVAGCAQVAAALDMPVAAGESVFALPGHVSLIESRACDNLMLNLMRCGGPTEFMQIAGVAASRHLPISSHTFTEISIHLVAAIPGATFAEYLPGWWDNLFEEPLQIEQGKVRLTTKPGLGLVFSQELIKRYSSH
jgi:mandelate racemase